MKKTKSDLFIILFFIIIFVILILHSLLAQFSIYDETWNFQNIYKMYNGGKIYTDNNVIVTPLFFMLGNFFFHILGANLFTFRIYNAFIYLAKYLLIFFILKKSHSHSVFVALYISIFVCLDYHTIPCGANYNTLAMVFCLLGILWYFTSYEKKSYHLWQGIIIFLVFFTKQTIGVYYAFGVVLFELLTLGFHKQFFQNQLKKLATFLPCIIISLIIMHLDRTLFSFIDLCFCGLFEFGSSNYSFDLKTLKYIIFMIFTCILSIFIIVKAKKISAITKRNIKFLLCLSLGLSFCTLPIINKYHINMSLLFYYLLFIYIIDSLLIQEILLSNSFSNIIKLLCYTILLMLLITLLWITLYVYFSQADNYTYFDHNHPFYNAPICKDDFQKIQEITTYISNKKKVGIDVIILSYEAAGYMVPLNSNHNELDLLFSGNLGYNGVSKTIDKISKMQNTEFLIFTNENNCFYQESLEIRDYIINNLKKIGNFINYSIYINK